MGSKIRSHDEADEIMRAYRLRVGAPIAPPPGEPQRDDLRVRRSVRRLSRLSRPGVRRRRAA